MLWKDIDSSRALSTSDPSLQDGLGAELSMKRPGSFESGTSAQQLPIPGAPSDHRSFILLRHAEVSDLVSPLLGFTDAFLD